MSFLDAQIPGLSAAQASFAAKAAIMRSTIASAEAAAVASQAVHVGESAVAFQAAHARFVAAAQRINYLLDVAQANIGEASVTYAAQDAAAAGSYGFF